MAVPAVLPCCFRCFRCFRLRLRLRLRFFRLPCFFQFFDFYWEADLASNPRFPAAVKFIIATVPELFGTPDGAKVQHLCQRWGWPLVWSLGTNPSGVAKHPPSWPAKARVLDPRTLKASPAGHNFSRPALERAQAAFQQQWDGAAAARAKTNASQADFAQWWVALETALVAAEPALAVEPLAAGACHSSGSCIGTSTFDGSCVCYE